MSRKPGVLPTAFEAAPRPRLVAAANPPEAFSPLIGCPLYVQDDHADCLTFGAFNATAITDFRKGIKQVIDNALPFNLFVELGGMPEDSGLDPAVLFTWWRANPINGYRLENIESLALGDFAGQEQAIIDTGFCFMTAMLTQAQLTQSDWATIPGSPQDGGHCFLGTGVIGSRFNDATWPPAATFEKAWFAQQGMNAWRLTLVAAQ